MATAMPRWRARRQISATGRITAVGDVMWLTTISRVRSVAAAKIASAVSFAVRNGSGSSTVLRRRCDLFAGSLPDALDRAIFMVGEQHFVAGSERKRIGNDVHADGRVLDENQVVRRSADKCGPACRGPRHRPARAAARKNPSAGCRSRLAIVCRASRTHRGGGPNEP